MKTFIKSIATLAFIGSVIGCAGYDQWAENTNRKMNTGWTEALYGKQELDSSRVSKDLKVDIRYGKGEASGIPGPASSKFYDKLVGSFTYNKNCRNMIKFDVALLNNAGVLVRSETILQPAYMAGMTVSINKDVIADPMMQKSNQVNKLLLSNLQCM